MCKMNVNLIHLFFCEKYVKKGSVLSIVGEIRYSSWEKDGQKHYMTKVVCESVEGLTPKAKTQGMESFGSSQNMDEIPF